jgi:hypothetical protein
VAVKPQGEGSHVTMTVDVEPDALAEVMAGTYTGFLTALKAKAEGS